MKYVLVIWRDAMALAETTWYSLQEVDDLIPVGKKGELVHTLGYLLRDDEDGVIVARSRQPESLDRSDSGFDGVLFVPRKMVTEMTVLGEVEE